MKRFKLPENAKMDQVRAAMENEVLTVTVPKEEEKKPEILYLNPLLSDEMKHPDI
ncbi:HSP20-like chaperone [Sesbania bispinosa]|nr:HSP20-like chaperone [Sesbania bispinosa]